MGSMVDKVHRELTDDEITRISQTYHAWRGDDDAAEYSDLAGFCKSATLDQIDSHDFVLTPGRYVGAQDAEDDGEPFEAKVDRLTAVLERQFARSSELERAIKANLGGLRGGE
jgi:type I restriction enzyme M protein